MIKGSIDLEELTIAVRDFMKLSTYMEKYGAITSTWLEISEKYRNRNPPAKKKVKPKVKESRIFACMDPFCPIPYQHGKCDHHQFSSPASDGRGFQNRYGTHL